MTHCRSTPGTVVLGAMLVTLGQVTGGWAEVAEAFAALQSGMVSLLVTQPGAPGLALMEHAGGGIPDTVALGAAHMTVRVLADGPAELEEAQPELERRLRREGLCAVDGPVLWVSGAGESLEARVPVAPVRVSSARPRSLARRAGTGRSTGW